MPVRIVDKIEITTPISAPIRNAYLDFTKMTTSFLAVITDRTNALGLRGNRIASRRWRRRQNSHIRRRRRKNPEPGNFLMDNGTSELRHFGGMTAQPRIACHDSRISNSRRPSLFSSFFTAPDAATVPWLA